ncbi:MAG TPA: hypothetical protein VK901_22025, partial [Nitrospiraceae bacterium]|nr:hypothetical protein [Nitrospiraceae bacterium]
MGDHDQAPPGEETTGLDSLAQYYNLFRCTSASKGLVVVFEDGTIHGGGMKAKREGLEHTRCPVEVTFEDAEPGPANHPHIFTVIYLPLP